MKIYTADPKCMYLNILEINDIQWLQVAIATLVFTKTSHKKVSIHHVTSLIEFTFRFGWKVLYYSVVCVAESIYE